MSGPTRFCRLRSYLGITPAHARFVQTPVSEKLKEHMLKLHKCTFFVLGCQVGDRVAVTLQTELLFIQVVLL